MATALREVAQSPAHADRVTLAATLRRAKRRLGLASAIADIGGLWPLERVTAALSSLAETALDAAVAFALRAAVARRALHLPPGRRLLAESGFTVLGMGKLGARELNYSSDIDLVLIYDPARHPDRRDGLGATSSPGWPGSFVPLWRHATRTATSSAPTCGCGPTRAPRRPRWPCPPHSHTTRAWARTGSAPP